MKIKNNVKLHEKEYFHIKNSGNLSAFIGIVINGLLLWLVSIILISSWNYLKIKDLLENNIYLGLFQLNIIPLIFLEYFLIYFFIINIVAFFKKSHKNIRSYVNKELIFGFIIGLILGLVSGSTSGLIIGLVSGLIVGLVSGLFEEFK